MTTRRLNTLIQVGGAVTSTLGRTVRTVTDQLGTMGRTVTSLNRMQSSLFTSMNRYATQGRNVDGLTRALTRVRSEMEAQERITRRVTDLQNRQRQNTQRGGELRGQLTDAVALGALLAAPVMVAATFEQAMARVGAVSRATDEELVLLTATARQLGATTEWSASQAGEGMQYLAMAGFSVNDILTTMPGLLSLATAAQIDLGRASDISSNILSGFGLQASDMGRVGDVLVSTFTSSNVTLEMLGDTMRYVAPIANATGASMEEMAAATGLLGNAGIQGTQAGTSLRAMLSRLAAPTSRAAAHLMNLGVETADASGNLRPMVDILGDMSRAMEGMGTADQSRIMSDVFGLEAVSAATVLLAEAGTGNLARFTASVSEMGAAQRVASRQADTMIGSWKVLKSALEENAIILGGVLLPVVRQVTTVLASGAQQLGLLAERYPQVTRFVTLFAAALVTMRIAAIAGAYGMTILNGAMLTARIVMLRVVAALRFVAVAVQTMGALLLANPIILVITAIAAAAILLYVYWDPIKAWWGSLWGDITLLATFAWQLVKDLLGWDPMTIITPIWTGLLSFWGGFWDGIKWYFSTVFTILMTLWSWSPIGMIVSRWAPVGDFFAALWDGIVGSAQRALDWVLGKIGAVADAVKGVLNLGGWLDETPRVDQYGNPIDPNAPAATGTPGTAMPAVQPMAMPQSVLDGLAEGQGAGALPELGAASGEMPDWQGLAAGGGAQAAPTQNNEINLTINGLPRDMSDEWSRRIADEVMRQIQSQGDGALYDGAAG